MRTQRIWWLLAIACVSCGGQTGTLSVSIVTPVGDDPFAQAAQARISLGNPPVAQTTVNVSGGSFDATLKYNPSSTATTAAPVIVEALDAMGNVTAHGRSPPLALVAADSTVAVFVGRVGRVGVAPAMLPSARARSSIGAIPRLGALVAGGVDGNGKPVADAVVYDEYSQQLVQAAPTATARADATVLPFDRSDSQTGAAILVGGGASEATEFDPLIGTGGQWSTLMSDPSLGASGAAAALQGDQTWLVAGGVGSDGKPLAQAATIVAPPSFAAKAVAAPMLAARAGHTATPVAAAQGAGVLLVGGAASGPAAELYLTASRTFVAVDLGAPSRSGHSATALADGRVLVLGGSDGDSPAHDDAIVIAPSTLAPMKLPMVLATGRAGHTAALVSGEVVVCGGTRADGTPIADCEVLDGGTLARKRTVPLAAPRTGHAAVGLDSGDLMLLGGVNATGPVASVEIYTAP